MAMVDVNAVAAKGEDVLKEFVTKMGLEGAIVASSEGLEIVHYFVANMDTDIIAAEAASVLSAVQGFLADANKGNLHEIITKADNGYVAVMALGGDVVLAVMAPQTQKLGVLTIAMRQLAKKLQSL